MARFSDKPRKNTDEVAPIALPCPATGNKITYDSEIKGFGVRVTKGGARSFILNYRNANGRERRITIGNVGEWTVNTAREEAARLKRLVDTGQDPMGDREEARAAKTVDDLCDWFIAEHLPTKRPATQVEYLPLINNEIRPRMKHEVLADTDAIRNKAREMHAAMVARGAATRANRAVAVLSSMFGKAKKSAPHLGIKGENPIKDAVTKTKERKRRNYLKLAQYAKLRDALEEFPKCKSGIDREKLQSVNIIKLLLLTGCRSGELLGKKYVIDGKEFHKPGVTWDQFDLDAGVWLKPHDVTKQDEDHEVPLPTAAVDVLRSIPRKKGVPYVFPGRDGSPYQTSVKKAWREIAAMAGIPVGRGIKGGITPHDIRHSYASVLISNGFDLPDVGAMLGHSQPATTARYAHVYDERQREAADTVDNVIDLDAKRKAK